MTIKRRKRVLVAMSGGVDSSVAALLLVKAGYEVVGVTMQVWDYSDEQEKLGLGTCCSSQDVEDARMVAERLQIPFYVLNCEAHFRQSVIDPFLTSYAQGQTPLPCVNCNTYLKFDHLIAKMHELECDFLATGHYAQAINHPERGFGVYRAVDITKDQTYFLFTLERDVLSRLLFPLGDLVKKQVRFIAEENGLLNHAKKDSTGICFVGKRSYAEFFEEQRPDVAKNLVGLIRRYPDGEVLGEHKGVYQYTYGQRKGLGAVDSKPTYVVHIDSDTNDVWVGDEKYLYRRSLWVSNVNWLSQNPLQPMDEARVKIRYQHEGIDARLLEKKQSDMGESLKLEFAKPVRAITPGQAAVFYRETELCGGGWIETDTLF